MLPVRDKEEKRFAHSSQSCRNMVGIEGHGWINGRLRDPFKEERGMCAQLLLEGLTVLKR